MVIGSSEAVSLEMGTMWKMWASTRNGLGLGLGCVGGIGVNRIDSR